MRELMQKKIEEAIKEWLPENPQVFWSDERMVGGLMQKHVLVGAPGYEGTEIKLLRVWMNGPYGPPAVSVDVEVPYALLSGPKIDKDDFPFSDAGEGPLAKAFRESLADENVAVVWCDIDPTHASFVARTAKVGRTEQVVAASVTMKDGAPEVEIGFRADIEALDVAPAHKPGY